MSNPKRISEQKSVTIKRPPEGADQTKFLLGIIIRHLEGVQRTVQTGANKISSALRMATLPAHQQPDAAPPTAPAPMQQGDRYQQQPSPGDYRHGVPHAPVRCGWCKLFKNARCSIGSYPALGGPAAGECASFTESEACARIRSAESYLLVERRVGSLGDDAKRIIDVVLDRLRGVA